MHALSAKGYKDAGLSPCLDIQLIIFTVHLLHPLGKPPASVHSDLALYPHRIPDIPIHPTCASP
jgi:hypothetical protein